MPSRTGVINICKETGYTSHDIVAIVKKITGTKAGHTGTLDPDACGVLPVCIGRATKFASFFAAEEKTYVSEVVLGVVTDTWDMTGEVLDRKEVSTDKDEIIRAVESFGFASRGVYMQVPPMYSAVKVRGKKLYELARKGETIHREPRPVEIKEIFVREFMENGFVMELTCSKGTYVRSLCMDIGEMLGCGAAMGQMTRTASGLFRIEDAVTLDDLRNADDLDGVIKPLGDLLPYPALDVLPEWVRFADNGNPIEVGMLVAPPRNADELFWLSCNCRVVGLYKLSGNKLRPEVML